MGGFSIGWGGVLSALLVLGDGQFDQEFSGVAVFVERGQFPIVFGYDSIAYAET